MDRDLVSLNELLVGDRLFDIPVYQRGYAWQTKHLQDLWEDLYYLHPSKKHYFGTVLLKDSGNTKQAGLRTFKRLDVIDGQQRLTTILILVREIISQVYDIEGEDFRNQVSMLEENYLKYQIHYKLNPLGSDGEFFKEFIISGRAHLREDTETLSQKRLVEAKDFFKERIEEEKTRHPTEFARFLVELKGKVDDLQLIRYLVRSDTDAIRIFETVNDRGKPLSNLEKTKSFLMHISYLGLEDEGEAVRTRLEELNKCFSKMYRYFEDTSRAKNLGRLSENDVQRYHFNNYVSNRGELSEYLDRLKSDIRNRFRQDSDDSVQYALDYANDLEQAFFAVKDIVANSEKMDELGILLHKVFTVGRLGNIFPLLITSWLRFRGVRPKMAKILKLLEAFTFRVYSVGNKRRDTGRSWLYSTSHNVHEGRLDCDALIGVLNEINKYYQNDDRLKKNLHSEDFYNRLSSRDIKYLMSEYEIRLRENSREPLRLSQEEVLSSEYGVEHIWARNPRRLNLQGEMLEVHEQNVHRLGNLTLASQSWNASMGNKPFEEKKLTYRNSSLRVQRELADHGEWSADTIREREGRIVEFALQRWNV